MLALFGKLLQRLFLLTRIARVSWAGRRSWLDSREFGSFGDLARIIHETEWPSPSRMRST